MIDADLPDRRTGRTLRAIVLGVNGHPRTMAAVRSLARAGIPLVGVKAPVASPTVAQECYSRYLRRSHAVPAREEELLPFLESLGDEGGVLFPIYDPFIR